MQGYADWESPPGWDGLNPSCDRPHGSYVRLYANSTAMEETADSGPYAAGSTFVLVSDQDTAMPDRTPPNSTVLVP